MTFWSRKNRLWPLCLCLFGLFQAGAAAPAWAAPESPPFLPFYKDKSLFLRAMEKARTVPSWAGRVTGLTLPHHLPAADIMAGGLAGLRGQTYERIIVISPEHYKRGKTPFSVPARDFLTCLGPVSLDRAGAAALLANPLVSPSNLFSHEHGVRALLPFLAAMFPDTPVLPVALSVSSDREQWDSLAESLRPLLTENTLLLQSTDFSHYLTWPESAIKDGETLRVLASGREDLIPLLHQPSHLDSRAAQYLQIKLQRERFGARALVTANHNACEYLPPGEACPDKTTSYIVQVYSPDTLPVPKALPGYVLGGDFFTGRYLRKYMERPEKRAALVERIRNITGGRPLILNFEGVLAAECSEDGAPGGAEKTRAEAAPRLCMPEEATLALLRDINCVAVSLANNHSGDFGPENRARTRALLEARGIAVLEDGTARAFPEFTLIALTDLDNNGGVWMSRLISGDSLGFLAGLDTSGSPEAFRLTTEPGSAPKCRVKGWRALAGRGAEPHSRQLASTKMALPAVPRPLAAFVHCGLEFRSGPEPRERFLARMLEDAGVTLFVGTHPHRAGPVEADAQGMRVWSLGNFLFDQLRRDADGAVLDLVFFPQGTWWARQRPIGNLYKKLAQ